MEIIKKATPLKGAKNDVQEAKQKWHSMPLAMLHHLADAYHAGLKKYWKFSCLEPFDNPNERFFDPQMRHLEACQVNPLAIDPETGCYHQAQVAFNALMRLHHCLEEHRKGANGQATTIGSSKSDLSKLLRTQIGNKGRIRKLSR